MKPAWIFLLMASFFEIVWAISLKYAAGFTKLWPSVVTVIGALASFLFLAESLKNLPVGTAYAIWTGIGAAGTAVLGMWLFGESRELARILCLLLILTGIIGLKLTS